VPPIAVTILPKPADPLDNIKSYNILLIGLDTLAKYIYSYKGLGLCPSQGKLYNHDRSTLGPSQAWNKYFPPIHKYLKESKKLS
jgi:hypothetical protein